MKGLNMRVLKRFVAAASLLLALLTAACSSQSNFNDDPRNIVWREALAQAGVAGKPRIRELTLEEASLVLGSCVAMKPSCADLVLETQPDLRGPALATAWPHALNDMDERFLPILLARGAVANEEAMVHAMRRPRERSAQRLAVIGHLLAAGAPVDAENFDGETALQQAAEQSDTPLVQLLLQHGAEPARKNRDGLSARQLALAQGADEIVALLPE